MEHIFVCYAREDREFGQVLKTALETRKKHVWMDVDDLPASSIWRREIEDAITGSIALIFLASKNSVDSEYCRRELGYAQALNKRIFTILLPGTVERDLPESILARQWLRWVSSGDRFTDLEKLINDIETDYEWVKFITDLGVKSSRWEQHKDNGRLLRGNELRDAERQLSIVGDNKKPKPTELQRMFVKESRKAEAALNGRLRTLGWGIAGAAILAVIAILVTVFLGRLLGIYLTNTGKANINAKYAEATAQNAAASANDAIATAQQATRIGLQSPQDAWLAPEETKANLGLSFLLSIEAYNNQDNYQTRGALLDLLRSSPHLQRFLIGDSQPIASVAFSADGRKLISASHDGLIVWWDLPSGNSHTVSMSALGMRITSTVFSPDGSTLALGGCGGTGNNSACNKGRILLWNVATDQPLGNPLYGHTDAVTSLSFSRDGKLLVSGSYDGSILVWDLTSRQVLGTALVATSGAAIQALSLSADNTILASSDSLELSVWDLGKDQLIRNYFSASDTTNESLVFSLAFSPDGKTLAAGYGDGTIILWDIDAKSNQVLFGHSDRVSSLAFSPDGSALVSGSYDKTVMLWNVGTGLPHPPPLIGHSEQVVSVAFSPDGETLASGGGDSNVILWEVAPIHLFTQPFGSQGAGVYSMSFSPDGKILATGTGKGDTTLWDVMKHQPIGEPIRDQGMAGLQFTPDGKTLVTETYVDFTQNTYNSEIALWNVATLTRVGNTVRIPSNGLPSTFAISPDGRILVAGTCANPDNTGFCAEPEIVYWNLRTQQPIGSPIRIQHDVDTTFAFSPDGKLLASAGCGATQTHATRFSCTSEIVLWNASTHESIGSPLTSASNGAQIIRFSPNGELLAEANADHTIILWDMSEFQPVGSPLAVKTVMIKGLAFDPDGSMLASGSLEGSVTLWDVATGHAIGHPLSGASDRLESMTFSPDGRMLATGDNGTISLWDVDPRSWVERICQIVGRNLTKAEWLQFFPNKPYHSTCPQWQAGS